VELAASWEVGGIGLVGVLGVEGNGIIQIGDVGGFFQGGRVSYFYFHLGLRLEVEDVAMEGFSKGEVWDGQCENSEGCCIFCNRMGLDKISKFVSSSSSGINWLKLLCEGITEGIPGRGYVGSKISPPEKGISLEEGCCKGD